MLGLRRLGGALLALGVRHPYAATWFVGAATFAALWLAPLDRTRAVVTCGPKQSFQTVMFSKDGARFAAYFVEYGKGVVTSLTVELYDTATGAHVSTLMHEKGNDFHDMNTNRDADLFAARRKDGTTTVWSLATGKKVATENVVDLDRALVVGDGGRLLLFERDPVRLRDAVTNEIVAELPADDKARVVSREFDRDQHVVRCSADAFQLYRKSNLQRVASLPAFRKTLDFRLTSAGMCSADGSTCVVAGIHPDTTPGTPSLPVYNVMYHRETGRWTNIDRWRGDAANVSPDGRLAFRAEPVRSNARRISAHIMRLLGMRERQEVAYFLHVFDPVSRKTVARINDVELAFFSPDNATLITPTPSPGSTLQLWDFPVRKPWRTITAGTACASLLTASLLLLARQRRSRPPE